MKYSFWYRTHRCYDGQAPCLPKPVTETVKRGMTEHDAKSMARGWTKSLKKPGRYKAIRCGRTWDVVRTE